MVLASRICSSTCSRVALLRDYARQLGTVATQPPSSPGITTLCRMLSLVSVNRCGVCTISAVPKHETLRTPLRVAHATLGLIDEHVEMVRITADRQ